MTVYLFAAYFLKGGVGATPSDTPTLTAVNLADSVVINAAPAVKAANLPGLVLYQWTGDDGQQLIGRFHSTDTTLDKPYDLPSFPLVCQGPVQNLQLLAGAVPNNLAQGAMMDLVNVPNPTAVTAVQSGLATLANQATLLNRLPAALTADGNMKADALKLGGAVPNNLAAGSQMDLIDTPNAVAVAAVQSGLATLANQTVLLGRIIGTLLAGDHSPQSGDAYSEVNTRLPTQLTAQGLMAADALLLNGATPNNLAVGAEMALTPALTALMGAIDSKTSNLPPDPADQSDILAGISAVLDAIANITLGGVTVSLAVSATDVLTVSQGNLSITAGYTFRQTVMSTMMQDLSSASKLWLAIKRNRSDLDSEALVLLEKTEGLTVVRGTPYTTPLHGSLAVRGVAGAWEVDIYLDEQATAELTGLDLGGLVPAGLKVKVGDDDLHVWQKTASVVDGIVQSV